MINLDTGWRFSRSDAEGAATVAFDDREWEAAVVPHDWAIDDPFDREHDLQWTRIVADGETQRAEHTGRTGGLPHVGVGWYRLRLDAPETWAGKRVWIEFDGVMSHAEVFLNGEPVGAWPYGYASFAVDLTDDLTLGGENVLAVRAENLPCASRWYPGAGICRARRVGGLDRQRGGHREPGIRLVGRGTLGRVREGWVCIQRSMNDSRSCGSRSEEICNLRLRRTNSEILRFNSRTKRSRRFRGDGFDPYAIKLPSLGPTALSAQPTTFTKKGCASSASGATGS